MQASTCISEGLESSVSVMRCICKPTVLALLTATSSMQLARCEEAIMRTPDGRYLVELNGATVALTDDGPRNQQIGFYVSAPPGSSPLHFYLDDLLGDPDRYARRLRSSEWSEVSVSSSTNHPHEIIGIPVARGVYRVGIFAGVDKNCETSRRAWSRLRDAALDVPADQYGWTRQESATLPVETRFIKFLNEGDRRTSRYRVIECEFSGGCSTRACRDGLTAWIKFYSSNKPRNEDYSVKEFDQQIDSGKNVLERMLVDKSVDLSLP